MAMPSGLNQLYVAYPIQIGAVIGGLLGLFVISPIAMVLEHLTHTAPEEMWGHLKELYSGGNPAWLLFFTLLGVLIGMMFGYMEKRLLQLQTGLDQADKLATVGQLAAGVAHEINTPLSNISIKVDTVMMGCDDPKVRVHLEEISNQVDRASSIVKDLLEYSSPAGVGKVEVNVNEVLSRVLEFARTVRREDVRVQERYREDIPPLLAEPNQLHHAFSNLVNNAYDAMPGGGVLDVTTDVNAKGCIVVEIRDDGTGIPSMDAPRVFDPFFTTKEPGKGTGLGLSISQHIIKGHGGRMELSSVEGEGTTVRVLFRRRKPVS